jgi:hypothetical protein
MSLLARTSKFVFLFLLSLSLSYSANAISEIIVAGDSWANQLCMGRGYTRALTALQVKKLTESAQCTSTSKSGMTASAWGRSGEHSKLIQILRQNPTIEFVHFSIGGNDLIAKWHVDLSPEAEAEVFRQTAQFMENAIQAMIEQPQVKVILSGYDYPRFTENHPVPNYREKHEKMGSPNPSEINLALTRFVSYLHNRFALNPKYQDRFFLISHLGMSQYYDGAPEAGIPPQTTAHPDQISNLENPAAVGGNSNFMSAPISMRVAVGGISDPFHLSLAGDERQAQHTYQNIIRFILPE